MKSKARKKYSGFVKMGDTKKGYQICELSINKKEIILSIVTPTVLQLI